MDTEQFENTESFYSKGLTLNDAIFEYGDSTLLAELQQNKAKSSEIWDGKETDISKVGISAALAELMNGLSRHSIASNAQKRIIVSLQADIIEKLKNGLLWAFGYQLPRNLKNKPIKIPADLFLSAEINWSRSTLSSQGIDFAGVRILKKENVIRNGIHKHTEKNKKLPETIKKAQKLADLDPEQLIDEKQAAEFLRISPRTLQGYRTKGGGPEFVKLQNRIVRYKVKSIIEWTESNKKSNTY